MRTKTNRLSKLLAVMLCLSMAVLPAAAAHESEAAELEPSPRYTGLVDAYVGLDINSSGRSTSTGEVYTRSGYTADVTMELQQKDGSQWEEVRTWTDVGADVYLEKDWYVASGYEYRVELSIEVSNSSGRVVDDVTIHSGIVEY